MTAVDIRKKIINNILTNPILGENYVDWHTENGECGLTIMLGDKKFDIIIKEVVGQGK